MRIEVSDAGRPSPVVGESHAEFGRQTADARRARYPIRGVVVPLLLGAGFAVWSGGCIETSTAVGPEILTELTVRLRPDLDPVLANTPASLRIARLQAEVRLGTSGDVLANTDSAVDPDEPVAELKFDVQQGSELVLTGQLRLIGEDEQVQWSGVFGPASVNTQSDTLEFVLEMGRGDFSNLSVTGISLSGLENGLPEGQTGALEVVVGGGSHDRVVFWGSEDPAIVVVDGAGNVTGVSPGEATVVAAAGRHAASVTVQVLPNSGGS
jgi:hypothetical protein